MKRPYLERLRALSPRLTLRDAIIEICRPFAEMARAELIDDGERGYFCYVELATPDERFALTHEVGGFVFAGGVCFFIPRRWSEAT